MKKGQFWKGMLMGIAAGASLGAILAARKKPSRSAASGFLKAAGEVVESISDALGR